MIPTKYLLTILFATLSISAFSQKVNWGLKFGGGIANQRIKNNDIICHVKHQRL